MTSKSKLTVYMHEDLVDALDYGFSPGDGIAAIDDVFKGLPKLHRSQCGKKRSCRIGNWLRTYRCRLSWYPLGISYVQIGYELHVVEIFDYESWLDLNPGEIIPVVSAPVRKGKKS